MITTSFDENDLYTNTISVLTQAAIRPRADGTARDFVSFLTHVLAATAANVGGPDHMLADPRCPEEDAQLVKLLRATMGDGFSDWLWFRTAPVTIRLNVAQLIEDDVTHPGLMGLDEALENIGRRHESSSTAADVDAWDHDIEAATARYTHEYQLYARRFTTAAGANAAQLPGLTVRVEVHTDTDPCSPWWTGLAITNPSPESSDPIALQIWHAAHDATPLPNVDIWPGPSTTATAWAPIMTSLCTRQELEADAIQVLTRAAHETTRATEGADFAGFLARVLASTAANVGGPRQLHARPAGSPAAYLVCALLSGTFDDDLDQWLPHRTQPVLIALNVAEIVEGDLHSRLLGLAAAIGTVVKECSPMGCNANLLRSRDRDPVRQERYRDEYRSYADRSTIAAQAAGVEHGLRAGVRVTADTNPSSDWQCETAVTNPRDGAGDQVACTLWALAHAAIAPPHVAPANTLASDLHHVSRGV